MYSVRRHIHNVSILLDGEMLKGCITVARAHEYITYLIKTNVNHFDIHPKLHRWNLRSIESKTLDAHINFLNAAIDETNNLNYSLHSGGIGSGTWTVVSKKGGKKVLNWNEIIPFLVGKVREVYPNSSSYEGHPFKDSVTTLLNILNKECYIEIMNNLELSRKLSSNKDSKSSYNLNVADRDSIDVYDICTLTNMEDTSGSLHHAIKKMLFAGSRNGNKTKFQDITEARDSLNRWLEINKKES